METIARIVFNAVREVSKEVGVNFLINIVGCGT
jgi:hypothetical protein